MRTQTKEAIEGAISLLIIVALFVFASYYTQLHAETLRTFALQHGPLGMVAYIIIFALSIVVAPVSSIPFMPIGAAIYGWFLGGILAIVGWTLGATIAFWLSRTYGKPLVKKVISLKSLERVESYIPKHHLFWSVVFIRMALPTDGLSYGLGLFSKMKLQPFVLSTLIGVTPFALIFSYLGTLSIRYQVIGLTISLVIIIAVVVFNAYFVHHEHKRRTRRSKGH